MEVDYIFEQNATLQEMQHQKIMATAKLCAEYDGRRVKNKEYQELTKYRPPAAKRSHQVPL